MPQQFQELLLLSVLFATFGFMVWSYVSTSIWLPKSFQIQYDINRPYVLRILMRRLLGFCIYGLLPFLLITYWDIIGADFRLNKIGISFAWNERATTWMLILIPVQIIYLLFTAGKVINLAEYPEMRVRVWSNRLVISSAVYWILHISALEFLYRGLLLHSLLYSFNYFSDYIAFNNFTAVLICSLLYSMIHFFRRTMVAFLAIPYSFLLCYLTIDTKSLLPAILIHVCTALFNEWLSIYWHPEIRRGAKPNLKVDKKIQLAPALQKISTTGYTWINATCNVKATPMRIFYPTTSADITAIIQDAEKRKLRVRVVGSGHSFSEAAKSDDYLLDIKLLDKVYKTDSASLHEVHKQKHLITTEAGIILKKLNRDMDRMGLALINMGAVDLQTISGALLTGTHGTGIDKPAFPDMVRSIRLVGTDGQLLQIEPFDGITDPAQHDNDAYGKLIQDDDTFYSTVLSFGAMGVVYELILEVTTCFCMQEKREIRKWSVVKKELESGSFMKMVHQKEFVAFRVNPYELKGDHTVAQVEQWTEKKRPLGLNARKRNPLSYIVGNSENILERTIKVLNNKPKSSINRIEMALKSTKDRSYFNKSYKVLYQSGAGVIRHGISAEFAFEADGKTIVKVLEAIFEMAKKNCEIGCLYQTSHIPVRFAPASSAYLAPSYNEDKKATVYIDVPLLNNTFGEFEILERYQKMMIDLGGIPHWGKMNNALYNRNGFLKEKYKKLDTWMAVREELDPKGTFLSDFITKMGLVQMENVKSEEQMECSKILV